MTRKLKEALKDQQRASIIAFSTLNEIVIHPIGLDYSATKVFQKPYFIENGIVPYIDWGQALTPNYRDRSYPCFVMNWGRIL
jgi:hypothetical protein